MRKYIVPWLVLILASGLFAWKVAVISAWWWGIIAFFCMVPFLLLVIAGGDMISLNKRNRGGLG